MNLTKKLLRTLLLFLIIITSILGCKSKRDENIDKRVSNVPVYKDASSIKYSTGAGSIAGVIYKAKDKYPAAIIRDFYESSMVSRGYKQYINNDLYGCDGEWSYYIDGTIRNSPSVAHLNLCWIKNDTIALLTLKYYYVEPNNRPFLLDTLDDLNVAFDFLGK